MKTKTGHKKRKKKRESNQKQTSDEVHVSGDDALIIASVIVIASLSRKAGAMAAVVDKEDVAGIGRSDEVGDGPADVSAGGLSVGGIRVDQNLDVIFTEAISVHKAAVHPLHVVNAALQLCLGSLVVASYQHCLLRHFSQF